jgi:hypothetical protein
MLKLAPRWWLYSVAFDVVAGVILLAAGLTIPGFIVLGLGLVGATSLAFYVVGRSEDVERDAFGNEQP